MVEIPYVSLVTPSYNQGQFLEETILSVLSQDYPSIEYIIIDGKSSDNSVEIIKKYQNHLAYWVSEPDRGQTDAIIKGFQRARGSLLGWLCSDDILEPSMVRISVDYHLRFPKVGLTYGDRVRIDAKGNIFSLQRYSSFHSWFIRWGFSIPQETTLFKRSIYESVGGLNDSLNMAMDFDLWCKVSRMSKIYHIPAFLARFRTHSTNKSTRFTHQVEQSDYSAGWPAEYARIYQKHFGHEFSPRRIQFQKLTEYFLAMIERRTTRIQKEMATIEQIRFR
jgi:glycosyltransferase involved in cell wall biosynthesis